MAGGAPSLPAVVLWELCRVRPPLSCHLALHSPHCHLLYPGVLQTHSDFSLLRSLLLCQHTQDLIDTTSSNHYENYR